MFNDVSQCCTLVDRPNWPGKVAECYPGNRAPLQPNHLVRLPLGSVRPGGWLREQLSLMARGLTGQLPSFGDFLTDDNGWLGGEAEGWEEQAYWFRGFYPLAVLIEDTALLAEAARWIEKILGSADDDGYFGPRLLKGRVGANGQVLTDMWPHMVMIDALILHFEASGDSRVIPLLTRFFSYCRSLPDEQFLPYIQAKTFGDWKPDVQPKRAGDMLPHIYWLYNQTGEAWLLDLALRFYRRITPPQSEYLDHHIVNFTQRFAYPAVFSTQTGESWRFEQSEYWYQQHLLTWGQPRGIFGADENIRPGYTDPRQGFETCGFGEFAKQFYYLAALTGDTRYADRIEDLLFNHFPAAQSPDLRGVHYLTACNLPQLDGDGEHAYSNDYRQLAYSAVLYRCCLHNVAMTWPWYAAHQWYASADGGLVAYLFGDNTVTARIAGGSEVTIVQQTDYPFFGTVSMTIQTANDVTFPLYLRVPAWAEGMRVDVNGEALMVQGEAGRYLRIERCWLAGDTLKIEMPMDVCVQRTPRTGAATVNRGPFSYSLKIEEEWRECVPWEWKEGGQRWVPPAGWPDLAIFPSTPWNYGLCLQEKDSIDYQLIERPMPAGQPWSPQSVPLELHVPAKRILAWTLEPHSRTIQELQQSPIRSHEAQETITLIPLGAARLRIACFPVISDEVHAQPWLPADLTERTAASPEKPMDK